MERSMRYCEFSLTKQARAVWIESPLRQANVVGADELITELECVLKK